MRHHLVVLHEKYLQRMIAGRKHVECRLSTVRKPPFECVESGDLLWFKVPSGPIRAFARAGRCRFHFTRTEADFRSVIATCAAAVCAEPSFFRDAASWARYVSLIWIETVALTRPMSIRKSDQRAWVVLNEMPYPDMRVGLAKSGSTRIKART